MSTAQPFLRWAGSKRQILPLLTRYWSSDYTRYIEPFAGSACLFFRLQPKQAILSDINGDLISTYREIKHHVRRVASYLCKLEKGRDEYLALREMDPSSLPPPARAARFIYLNRFCFNGLYRTNQAGYFNVPYGGDKAGNLPSCDALMACSAYLKGARLVAGDFQVPLKRAKQGDFVYLDPPFSVRSRRVFNEYNPASFGEADILALRKWMEIMTDRRVAFLVSYAESDEADFLRKGFYSEMVSVKRNIAGFSGSRVRANEMLISNRRPDIDKEASV